jgi:hypothetical protein
MGGIGPIFGQVCFFHKFAGKDYEDKRPRDRYVAKSKHLRGVLNVLLALLVEGQCRRRDMRTSARACQRHEATEAKSFAVVLIWNNPPLGKSRCI